MVRLSLSLFPLYLFSFSISCYRDSQIPRCRLGWGGKCSYFPSFFLKETLPPSCGDPSPTIFLPASVLQGVYPFLPPPPHCRRAFFPLTVLRLNVRRPVGECAGWMSERRRVNKVSPEVTCRGRTGISAPPRQRREEEG